MAAGGKGRWLSAACGLVACLVLSVQAAPASAAEKFTLLKAFGPDGTSLSGFTTAGPVAVDQQADVVYVLDRGAGSLLKFDLEGNPVDFGGSAGYISGNSITGLAVAGQFGLRQVAVDSLNHTIYVTGDASGEPVRAHALQAFQADGEPALFTDGPGVGTNKIEGFGELAGVAVDGNGDIYASDISSNGAIGSVSVYAPSGLPITDFEHRGNANLAVDTNGVVYVNEFLEHVHKITPSEFPVTPATTYSSAPQPVNPSTTSSTVAVDPATNAVYVAEFQPTVRIAIFDEDGTFHTTFAGPGEEGQLDLPEGVAIDGQSEKVFVSNDSESGLSQVELFRRELIVDKPSIESTAVADVTAGSATFRTRINPNTLASSYRFEYGLDDCAVSACTSVPAGGAEIGSGHDPVAVSQSVTGLQPATVYHYRVVAENNLGVSAGADRTFTTQGAGLGFQLSDSRAWEMVSPPNKFGGEIRSSTVAPVQASVSGDALAYVSRGSIVGEPNGNRVPEPSSVLAKRQDGQWHSEDLTPPHTKASQIQTDGEYNLFSPDLSLAQLEPRDETPLSPAASEQTPYLRTSTEPPVFTPLVTSKEPYANVPPGTHFGRGTEANPLRMEGASPDLTHVVLRSQLTPLITGAAQASLYMWVDGDLEAISEMPEGEGGVVQGILGSGVGSVRHAVSNDGSRVFWSPTSAYGQQGIGLPALYLRETAIGESFRLDVAQPGASGAGEAHPAFQGASADGDVAFFTDSQQLTEDASPEGRDLYRCEIGALEGGVGCISLTDLSAPLAGSGESADVFDQVSALSEDGKQLYFVATGVLDDEANDAEESAVSGEPNLYIWQEGQGVRFIASLSQRDYVDWGGQQTQPVGFASQLGAATSPSGRYLAFTSERTLTDYENRNAGGELNEEVFVYDAVTSRLVCVSCNPSGAAATGQLVDGDQFSPADPGELWGGRWVAAILPEASESYPDGRSQYRSRSVLDNGRVFFNAVDPLVSGDSNGHWDVYQYEPIGLGSCTNSSEGAAVARSADGCVGLISSGTAEGDAGFLDASPSGDDVFFVTGAKLSVLDEDDAVDVYDARVNGTPAVLKPISECAGEACQPAAGPPNDPTPASESFRGPENAIHCPKGKRKVQRNGRSRCVPKHRKHKKHHQRAGKDRRPHR
jgi:hypothetical protein